MWYTFLFRLELSLYELNLTNISNKERKKIVCIRGNLEWLDEFRPHVSPRSRSIKLTNRELPSFKKKLTLSLVNRIGKVHAQNERD